METGGFWHPQQEERVLDRMDSAYRWTCSLDVREQMVFPSQRTAHTAKLPAFIALHTVQEKPAQNSGKHDNDRIH